MVDKPRYVDVNIFVYWLAKNPEFGKIAFKWINEIESSPTGEYVTSSLTIYEALVIISTLTGKNLRNKDFVNRVVTLITQVRGLVIEPVRDEDFINASALMTRFNLDYEDALHLAVAIRVNASGIVSNDKDFDKAAIKRII
jgi:predicted nucleic acid-binding protein